MSRFDQMVGHLFREQAGKMGAVLTRIFGFEHAALVEDVIQETFLAALKRWPVDGVPENAAGWLMQVAKNKTLNLLREEKRTVAFPTSGNGRKGSDGMALRGRFPGENRSGMVEEVFLEHEIRDSQLRVLVACCHPALSEKSRIVLTLRTLSGFSNAEIARALLSEEEAVKKSLYRSRNLLKHDRTVLDQISGGQLESRWETILTVLYLIFNGGYKSLDDRSDTREELCFEAMRLALLLADDYGSRSGSLHALLALFCFQTARFPARSDEGRRIIDLHQQDRTLWDRELIARGFRFLSESRTGERPSRYHLEAGIASLHCTAKRWEQTDWKGIEFYYGQLCRLDRSPVVRLNRAVAISYSRSPAEGLKALEPLADSLPRSSRHLVEASKADMLFRMGRYEEASEHYRAALGEAPTAAVRQFLESRIERCIAV